MVRLLMVHREIITWVDDGYVIAFGLVLLSIYSAALTFTAGLLTVAAVEEMLSESHESGEDSHISIMAFVGGFVLFVLVSAGLEGLLPKS